MYYFPNIYFREKLNPQNFIGFVVAIFWLLLLIIIFKPVYKKAIKSLRHRVMNVCELGYYYRLTNEIIRLNAKSTIEYKIDFIMYIVLQILYLLLSYFFIDLFVSKVQNIGLTTNEFYFYALLIDCVYSFFLNYPSMYYLISSGQIEVNLVKPVNIIYFLYLRYLSVRSLILFCFKTVFLIIFGIYLGVNPVFVFIVLIFTTIASTLLFQSFYYLVISFDFLKIELGRFIFDILSERHFRSFAQNYPIYFFPRIIITICFLCLCCILQIWTKSFIRRYIHNSHFNIN
jgi:ABC-type uncharacterized transport system permease subunit